MHTSLEQNSNSNSWQIPSMLEDDQRANTFRDPTNAESLSNSGPGGHFSFQALAQHHQHYHRQTPPQGTVTPTNPPLTPRGQESHKVIRETPMTPDKGKSSQARRTTRGKAGNSMIKLSRPQPPEQPTKGRKLQRTEKSGNLGSSLQDARRRSSQELERVMNECTLSGGVSPMMRYSQSPSNFLGMVDMGVRMSQATENTNTNMTTVSQDTTTYSQLLGQRMLRDFSEIRELGRGSYAKVVLAQESSSGDFFAIKQCPIACTAEFKQRTQDEVVLLSAARGLPHIVNLYNAWQDGIQAPTLYLQMEYCNNGSLGKLAADRRQKRHMWLEQELLVVLGQMAMAVDALHQLNIVHVDIKPDNILIDFQGNYVLSDFGNALVLDARERPFNSPSLHGVFGSAASCRNSNSAGNTPTGNKENSVPLGLSASQSQLPLRSQFIEKLNNVAPRASSCSQEEGDARYVSIDMMNEKQFYKPGDIFSLGMSLYELASSKPLPGNGNLFHELRQRTDLNELLALGYSHSLVDVLLKMISKDPLQRPTAREILHSSLLHPNNTTMSLLQSMIKADGRRTSFLQHHEQAAPNSTNSLEYSSPEGADATAVFHSPSGGRPTQAPTNHPQFASPLAKQPTDSEHTPMSSQPQPHSNSGTRKGNSSSSMLNNSSLCDFIELEEEGRLSEMMFSSSTHSPNNESEFSFPASPPVGPKSHHLPVSLQYHATCMEICQYLLQEARCPSATAKARKHRLLSNVIAVSHLNSQIPHDPASSTAAQDGSSCPPTLQSYPNMTQGQTPKSLNSSPMSLSRGFSFSFANNPMMNKENSNSVSRCFNPGALAQYGGSTSPPQQPSSAWGELDVKKWYPEYTNNQPPPQQAPPSVSSSMHNNFSASSVVQQHHQSMMVRNSTGSNNSLRTSSGSSGPALLQSSSSAASSFLSPNGEFRAFAPTPLHRQSK